MAQSKGHTRIEALDGVRGISILLVLACHMLPIGPKFLQLNGWAGTLGMSLFFPLSGFLITSTLQKNGDVIEFLIRRVFRIVPLAWLAAIFVLLIQGADLSSFLQHLFFIANYNEPVLVHGTIHFWSLCVEVQFYLAIALWMAITRSRGLRALPIFLIAITAQKIFFGLHNGMLTHVRVDEILGGACLALLLNNDESDRFARLLSRVPLIAPVALHVITCKGDYFWIDLARPYTAALLLGHLLLVPNRYVTPVLTSKPLKYIAEVSYALYVIHPITMLGWLGTGDVIVRYSKRIICFALTFSLAHLSTRTYEKFFMDLGKSLAKLWSQSERVKRHETAPQKV